MGSACGPARRGPAASFGGSCSGGARRCVRRHTQADGHAQTDRHTETHTGARTMFFPLSPSTSPQNGTFTTATAIVLAPFPGVSHIGRFVTSVHRCAWLSRQRLPRASRKWQVRTNTNKNAVQLRSGRTGVCPICSAGILRYCSFKCWDTKVLIFRMTEMT